MRNPLTGLEVVGIEGIEFTMPIVLQHNRLASSEKDNNWMSRSYYSRKFFVYVDKNNRTQPITEFKVSKFSPFRPVNPVKQLFESKLTFSNSLI